MYSDVFSLLIAHSDWYVRDTIFMILDTFTRHMQGVHVSYDRNNSWIWGT